MFEGIKLSNRKSYNVIGKTWQETWPKVKQCNASALKIKLFYPKFSHCYNLDNCLLNYTTGHVSRIIGSRECEIKYNLPTRQPPDTDLAAPVAPLLVVSNFFRETES